MTMLFCSRELHQRILHFSISKVQFYSDLLQSFGKFKEMQKRKRKNFLFPIKFFALHLKPVPKVNNCWSICILEWKVKLYNNEQIAR